MSGQCHLTFAFGQAHTMNLPCGQRVREPHSQPVEGKCRVTLSPPGLSPDPVQRQDRARQALTVWSGPQVPLSRSSSLGRSCARECHLHLSDPPPAARPGLGTAGTDGRTVRRESFALSGISTHPSASAAAHLGRGPPGSWSGSCGGPQQTCNRTRRAPGRPAEARGLPAARRCVPWAAWSSHPGSSAWCLERNTGPLPASVG